ncbi:nascent polypeptide-associated complex subunit alpha, muscle-specific form-like [Copidosoma floridanum]|uniref:nascent polypeptide-associated complex subunit alpha, muscle-specific form-like n=1 Tax=Copidosoma floridanum TaxID=29053 RepID=UPI0006C94D74|nr:nascent polypeptide-associated complex subunit alpha, muscle-specific form-like [Copidosoma floridanum]
MNYYQEAHNDFNDESMLGPISEPSKDDQDLEFDAQINALLDEVDQDLAEDIVPPSRADVKADSLDDKKEQYEDYYHEFPDEAHDEPNEIPSWYNEMLQKKVRETKRRLSELSSVVCMVSSSTREIITRIEQDHNTPFCKLDPPKHPSLKKPWTNYWRFNCVTKCSALSTDDEHAHTADCEILLLEHVGTSTSTMSENIFASEFPDYIMKTVEVFQRFADVTSKDTSLHIDDDDYVDSVYEKPTWTYIKIRSNYKSELQLTVCGKAIKPLIPHLKRFFHSGPGRACNVVSLYCINVKWSQKKGNFPPTFLDGCLELRDKVGPITINYTPKTSINFNSIEAIQLGLVMTDFLELCNETTLIDIGCNFGALSLMLSHKCDKVIGLNTLQHEIDTAEGVKAFNGIYNATFITCQPRDVQTKCMPLVKKCRSVAMLHLATPYGKNPMVYRALRALPAIWRVVVYGTFSKEFYKLITTLTSTDDEMGHEFLPARGCIIDKSPSVKDAFDIVILFERPPLIDKSVQYLQASGSKVNMKEEDWDSNSNDGSKFSFKKEKVFKPRGKFGGYDSPSLPIKSETPHVRPVLDPTPYNCVRGAALKKSRVFDCPSMPTETYDGSSKSKDNGIRPKTEKSLHNRPSPSLRRSEFDFLSDSNTLSPPSTRSEFDFLDASVPLTPKTEPFDQKLVKMKKEKAYETPYNDFPVLKPKWEKPFDQKQPKRKIRDPTKIFDYPTLEEVERKKKTAVVPPQPIKTRTHSPPLASGYKIHPSEIKREKEWSPDQLARLCNQSVPEIYEKGPYHPPVPKGPPTKHEKDPYYPPLPKEQPVVRQEKDHYSPPLPKQTFTVEKVRVKPEPRSPREKEEGELSSDDSNHAPLSNFKNEPMDLDSSNVSIKSEAMSIESSNSSMPIVKPSIVIKSEPIDVDDEEPMIIEPPKVEPIQPIVIKDDPDEFENMKTPVHVPAALSTSQSPSPPPATANFKTMDGFEFSVKPHQSFLGFKQRESHPDVAVKQEKIVVKEEPLDRPSNNSNSCQMKKVTSEDNSVNDDEDITIISEKPKKDLRDRLKYVIEDQKKNSEEDLRKLIEQRKNLQKQLVDEDSDYQPTMAFPSRRPRSRSGSPLMEQGWTRRYRSPVSESYYRRSPPSPRSVRRRSPAYLGASSPVRYFRRTPSPPSKYPRRMPPSPLRSRRSPSPVPRFGRPGYPYSKYPSSYSRSPPPRPQRRSPSYEPYVPSGSAAMAAYRWRHQSPSPPPKKYKYRETSRSSSTVRRSSGSPVPHSSRRKSRSSLSLSPPPTKRHKSTTSEEKKKKKKKKKDSSPGKDSEETKDKVGTETVNQGTDEWDIPALSTLSSKPQTSNSPACSSPKAAES